MVSAKLGNFPPELLRSIFECFCLHCHGGPRLPFQSQCEPTSLETRPASGSSTYWEGRQALYSLCLVSKQFLQIAQSILFHEFLIPFGGRVEPFMRTVVARTDLARMVRTVSLDPTLSSCLDIKYARNLLEDALHTLGTASLAQYWKQRRRCGTLDPEVDVFFEISHKFILGLLDPIGLRIRGVREIVSCEILVVLVALLANLQHLILDGHIWFPMFFPSAARALGLTRIPLKILDAEPLPSSIVAFAPDLETVVLKPAGSYPELPSVKEVYYRGGGVDDPLYVENLLPSCSSSLSAFSYQATTTASYYLGDSRTKRLEPRSAESLLAKYHSSLRRLQMGMRFRAASDKELRAKPMTRLKEFTALEELLLTTNSVYNEPSPAVSDAESLVHLLPQSIRSLTFVDPEFPPPSERLCQGLLGLAHAKRQKNMFPNLKRLTSDSKEIFQDMVIKGLFKQVGVDFKYQEFPTNYWIYSAERRPPSPLGRFIVLPPQLMSDDDL